jgi:hypothetical protein
MKKLNQKYFEEKLAKVNKYFNSYFKIVSEFKTCRSKIEVSTQYGNCLVSPYSLLEGNKPSIQTAINKNIFFINMAKEIHGNKYNYSLVDYKINSTKVKIICPIHGEFEQTPNMHLQGRGCPICNKGGWDFKLTDWLNTKNDKAIFYVLRCYSSDEEFIKIGITTTTIKYRYKKKGSMPYNFEIIHETYSTNKKLIWEMERKFINELKGYSYTPKLHFGGKTECFNIKIIKLFGK